MVVAARHAVVDVTAVHESAEARAIVDDDRAAVARALVALPSRQRQCIVLRFYGGTSDTECAALLGISPNSVKTHIRRGLAALGPVLEDRR